MKPYLHKVQYYETDKMGVTHHANYIRWMEEARVDFMEQMGFPYAVMEEKGVFSPVTSVSCDYKHPTTFGDAVSIAVTVEAFNGVVMTIGYDMKNQREETVCAASSQHVFLSREGRFVRLKREMPGFYDAIAALLPQPETGNS